MPPLYRHGKSPIRVTFAKVAIMQRHFRHLDAINAVADAIDYGCEVVKNAGALRYSYHVSPLLFDEPTSPATMVYSYGFPEGWMARYNDPGFRIHDPIPRRVIARGRMMTWSEAIEAEPNTPEIEAYVEEARAHGLVHGFGIPLFGLHGRDGYAAFDFGRPLDEVPACTIGLVRAIAQAAHQRVCVLIESAPRIISLSEREREVLEWLTTGKSLSVTADIMGLSPDTVKTYARRVYAKLDASDRVGAVVKALKLGLVRV